MKWDEYESDSAHVRASWAGFWGSLRAVLASAAAPLLPVVLAVWALVVLWGFIIAAHWAAELACGWEATWLRC